MLKRVPSNYTDDMPTCGLGLWITLSRLACLRGALDLGCARLGSGRRWRKQWSRRIVYYELYQRPLSGICLALTYAT